MQAIGLTGIWFIVALLTLWAVAALYVDFRFAALRIPVTLIYVFGIIGILLKVKPRLWAAALCTAGFGIVLAWWLSLRPSTDGDWQADVDRKAWAEMNGDRVTIHNLRNCDYRTETDYANCWSDRRFNLSEIRGHGLIPHELGHTLGQPPDIQLSIRRQGTYRILN